VCVCVGVCGAILVDTEPSPNITLLLYTLYAYTPTASDAHPKYVTQITDGAESYDRGNSSDDPLIKTVSIYLLGSRHASSLRVATAAAAVQS